MRQKTKNNVLKGQISVTRKEQLFCKTIKLCSKAVRYKRLDQDEW